MANQLKKLINELEYTPQGPLFNPWYQMDSKHDLNNNSPDIRRQQLYSYLNERLERASFLCIGEALGYQGGHFTGIAMTSERILLGHHDKKHGIPKEVTFQSIEAKRTSKPSIQPKGFSEPTATIMWKALLNLDIDPYSVVLWNALPWHPYDPESGMLSNRTPLKNEFDRGRPVLEQFLSIFSRQIVVAVGNKSADCLEEMSISHTKVRHPAHGGAPKFRRQMKELVSQYSA